MRRRYRGGINFLCGKGGKHTLPVDAFDFFIEKSYNTDIDRAVCLCFFAEFCNFKKKFRKLPKNDGRIAA